MAGAISQAAFCVAYAWTAQRWGWTVSLIAAAAGFVAITIGLNAVALPTAGFFVVIIVVIVVSLFLMPQPAPTRAEPIEFPAWDLPARMLVATAFVVVLTAVAPLLGARLAGLLAPFPLYGSVLAAFAHRIQGAGPAVGVVGGLLLGLFAFSSFFLVLSLLLTRGVALAFACAIVVALVVHGVSLLIGRRVGLA